MPVDITEVTSNLVQNTEGIWVSRELRDISYPTSGNELCYSVEETSFWFQHRNQVITQLVQQHSSGKSFFDIGGGNGCVSHALQQSEVDVVLVEPGPVGAVNARTRGIQTVVQSTFEDAGFAAGSMPSAGIFDVLEHIEADEQFLQSLHYYLEPEGCLYITVPAYQFLWANDDDHAGHYRRYTTTSLEARLTAAGFQIIYSSYLFAFLVPPIFLFRSLPSRMGLRKAPSLTTTQKEHSQGKGLAAKLVGQCLQWESGRIEKQKKIPFGSSCIAVAQKMP